MGLRDRFQEKAHELAEQAKSALGGKRSERAPDATGEEGEKAGERAEETTRQLQQRPDETEGPW